MKHIGKYHGLKRDVPVHVVCLIQYLMVHGLMTAFVTSFNVCHGLPVIDFSLHKGSVTHARF